jgi:hypothetical protein
VGVRIFEVLFGKKPTEPKSTPAGDTAGGLSRAQLMFLARFRSPQDVAWIEQDGRWPESLGEPPMEVIRCFREGGLLVPGSLADHLSAGHSVKELKELCRSHGLKVSGTREVLVARLVEAVPDQVTALVAGRTVLRCSQEAQKLAEDFAAESEARKAAAEAETREALVARDFRRACRAVALFEASQPFPRGMEMDWSHYDPEPDVVALSAAFERWPHLLAFVPGDSRDAFRIAAAETYLWGRSRTLRGSCLPHVEGPLNAEVTCRMLVAFAQTERTLHGLRESGTTLVVVCRNGSCAGCQEGPSIVALRSMPEIPRPECTNPEGCRCCLRPATQEERT